MAPSKYRSGVIATPIPFRYIAFRVEKIPRAITDKRTPGIQLAAAAEAIAVAPGLSAG